MRRGREIERERERDREIARERERERERDRQTGGGVNWRDKKEVHVERRRGG